MRFLRFALVVVAAALGAAAVAAAVEKPGGEDEPEAEQVVSVSGTLQADGKGFRIGERKAGLGPWWYRDTAKAASDLDGDGAVETITKELQGLVGKSVSVTGEADEDEVEIRTIAGKVYRAAGRPPWAGGKDKAAKCEARAARREAKEKQKDKAGNGRGGPPPWAKAYGFRRSCS
jgi:hypothetical protein